MIFEERIRELAEQQPHISLATAITLCDVPLGTSVGHPDPANTPAMAVWALQQPGIKACIEKGLVINAIKDLRTLCGTTYVSLKQAKDAVELAKSLGPKE